MIFFYNRSLLVASEAAISRQAEHHSRDKKAFYLAYNLESERRLIFRV